MKLNQWPQSQRPRNKLLCSGPQTLSDAELLAIFLRAGIPGSHSVDLAKQLITRFGSLRALLGASSETFSQTKGLGEVNYVQIQAVLELAKRFYFESLTRANVFESAEDTRIFLLSQLRDEPNEVFAVLSLDNQYRMIGFRKLFFGTINAANVYPRVIVKHLLDVNAAAVILTHNHPSGVAEPSASDKQITHRIIDALSLVDIKVLDHFVIGDGYAVSFAERGLL